MKINLLDYGYIELVESWGSDERIIEAARMSTGKGFLGWVDQCSKCFQYRADLEEAHARGSYSMGPGPGINKQSILDHCPSDRENGPHDIRAVGDEKLLRFLYENHHATPFEMAGLIVEVKAPIFVIREWHRHRTQSYNEMSARYTPLPDENYIPTIERLMMGGGTNKQASAHGTKELNRAEAELYRMWLKKQYLAAETLYQDALSIGVPKELARVHLPVGRYSRMRASANLRNWLGFMTLRSSSKAQWEIRQYSLALGTIIAEVFPRTWELFAETAPR